MKLVYFGYAYTDDPIKRTAEIKFLIENLLKVRTDIIPFVPHLAFDLLIGTPEGYSSVYVLEWELEVISRCDAVCFPPLQSPSNRLCGIFWETAFSRHISVPEYQYEDLLAGTEIRDDVAEEIIREAERELMIV